jgi:hypothetical protein
MIYQRKNEKRITLGMLGYLQQINSSGHKVSKVPIRVKGNPDLA